MKFDPHTGLIPAIIQDENTRMVLMLGYMNQDAFDKTLQTGQVTFWSRSRNALWTKGETSGNFLHLVSWRLDCDEDALLIRARPVGPVCHTGSDTCWDETNTDASYTFLGLLESIIDDRFTNRSEASYTSRLFDKGVNKIAQKVGEEATELVIEAKDDNDDLFIGEAADLLFHYLVLLRHKDIGLTSVIDELKKRHR